MTSRRAICIALLAAAAAGCGSSSAPKRAALDLEPCSFGVVRARCGSLRVAEDPGHPQGRRIPIRVAVIPARDPHPAPDPLFFFSGWGSAGVQDDLATQAPLLTLVNQRRDLVFIDQRGTGASHRLSCRLPGTALALPAVTEAARRCAARLGPNLKDYTSAVAVDDVDAVRAALGYERINVYGISYGGTTAQIYLRRHERRVRSMVLDGASLLDVRIFERGARNAQRALDRLLDRCAADVLCRAAYPDPRGDYARIVARLRRGPIAVPDRAQRLDRVAFADVLDLLIAYTSTKPVVPRLLHLVATGRVSEAAVGLPRGDAPAADDLAYKLLIQCSEPWASRRPDVVARLSEGTFLAPLVRRAAALVAAGCRGLPHATVPPDLGRRVRSAVPVLFLTGEEDPADPPHNVAGVRRELPNGRVVVFAAAGHGQLGLPCAQELIYAMVEHATTHGLDASCARTAAQRPFLTGG